MVIKQNCQQIVPFNIVSVTDETNAPYNLDNVTHIEFCFGDGRRNKQVIKTWYKDTNSSIPDGSINKTTDADGNALFNVLITENDSKFWTDSLTIQARIAYQFNGPQLTESTELCLVPVRPTVSTKSML